MAGIKFLKIFWLKKIFVIESNSYQKFICFKKFMCKICKKHFVVYLALFIGII